VNVKCGSDNLFTALPSPIKLKDDSNSYIISAAPVIGSAVGGTQVQAIISGFPRSSTKDSISIVSGGTASIPVSSARFLDVNMTQFLLSFSVPAMLGYFDNVDVTFFNHTAWYRYQTCRHQIHLLARYNFACICRSRLSFHF